MNETMLNGQTLNIAEENIAKLKTIFPDVFTEDKVDFEKLQQVLGNYIETSNERYNFSWNGKSKALRIAQTPSMGTLRPCKEESKDWDTTENLYIEGDNLEVLKLLQKSYQSKVKMIYIDPPYNTGNEFVYPDNFTDSIENYKAITGQTDSEGKNISSNSETNGRYHTDWLNMMYPRLRLARNLLNDDGVIFISIDDNELNNLVKLCDEIFGEDNFLALLTRRCMHTVRNSSKDFNKNSDFILVYIKDKRLYEQDSSKFIRAKVDKSENYRLDDNDERGPYKLDPIYARNYAKPYKFIFKNGIEWEAPQGSFPRYSQETLRYKEDNNQLDFRGKEPRAKRYLREVQVGQPPDTILKEIDVGFNSDGTRDLSSIIGDDKVFSQPKPVKLILYLMSLLAFKDGVVLDFFSGSATTAHAVMQLNAEDSGNRKFICVQLPEETDEKDEAYKAGYKNICEIGKERIRRAGDKIKEENGLTAQNLDIGFKVLKLDNSNIRKWQPDFENIEHSLTDFVENYVDGRTELDVVFEIMLKYGLDLTYSINEYTVENKKLYSIGFGMLIICLDNEVTTAIANGILDIIKELSPETTRVVFKDNGFKTDSNKTNIKEILKCGGIEEFITL